MDALSALHTAARRYCLERAYIATAEYQQWLYRYEDAKPASGGYFDIPTWMIRDSRTQRVFEKLLFAIEQTLPGDFASLDSLIASLCSLKQPVQEQWHRNEHQDSQAISQAEAMIVTTAFQGFCAFITTLTPEQLASVTPLPFRHYMDKREEDRLWYRLLRKWNIGMGCWYPLEPREYPPQPDNVIAFQSAWFKHGVPLATLHDILRHHSVWRVWELRMDTFFPDWQSAIIDLPLMVPRYFGKKCWSSAKRDWILYASHEKSITIGGEWFLGAVKAAWPAWEEHIYTDYVYPHPIIDE